MSSDSPWGENSLIGDLLEALETDPSNIEARRLLIDQYIGLDWNEAVADLAQEILSLQPGDQKALAIIQVYRGRPPAKAPSPPRAKPTPLGRLRKVATGPPSNAPFAAQDAQHLKEQYQSLREEAETVLRELVVFQGMAPGLDCLEDLADLDALVRGKMFSVARRQVDKELFGMGAVLTSLESADISLKTPSWTTWTPKTGNGEGSSRARMRTPATTSNGTPQSARSLALAMKKDPAKALAIAVADFEALIAWQKAGDSDKDDDTLRSTLRRRIDAVKSALPKEISHVPATAFMHAEHEHLNKTYTNAETMIGGDPISSIARDVFWVSEDNYAWDMEELVAAITASKGSLRNPLSKQPFSAADIEEIIRHPLGSSIAAVQIGQAKLRKGVRPETITRLKSMATILLSDNSENSFPSHQAVDEFLSYAATLPQAEREAIDKLKVPAVDSHTGQPFDDTIGDSVRDAKGNRICFHKAGDLLKQAAEYLGRS